MNLQQLQQQVRELAPAIAYVVTQREGEEKHFTLTEEMGYKPPRSGGLSILQFFLKTTNKLTDQVRLGPVVLLAILLDYLFFRLRQSDIYISHVLRYAIQCLYESTISVPFLPHVAAVHSAIKTVWLLSRGLE
jgi:hypothetical protein